MKKLILVGMNPRTLPNVPWEADAEIWTLNEAPIKHEIKRWDVDFQLHPRRDWERKNNFADPNHPLFIKQLAGPCMFCAGTGKVTQNGQESACPWCQDGQYEPPAHRAGKKIVMQHKHHDVPGARKLPIEQMTANFCFENIPYFTSTLAHMIVYAFHVKHDDISLYGFEMESGTEYAHQRACAEYWIGYGRARGIKIEAPGAGILKGEHYAYQTLAQGYRTRLELRKHHLTVQLRQAEMQAAISEGALAGVMPFKAMPEIAPAFDQRFDDHYRKKSFVSFLQGTIKEVENMIHVYDAYYADGNEKAGDAARALALTYELG